MKAPLVAAILATLLLIACGDEAMPASPGGSAARVVTTLPLLADFVRQVGGERVEVSSLLPTSADPHTYEPTPRDIQKLSKAELAIANGRGLEPLALKVMRANLPSGTPLIQLAEEIRTDEEDGGPHLWLDVANAREYARLIADALSRVDPGGTSAYRKNLERYLRDLEELDRYARRRASVIPPERRMLVTTHDAFRHLARYLGLEVVTFVVPGPGQEPSPKAMARLVQTIQERDVPAVFTEPQVTAASRILRQAAQDAGVQVCTLYSGALDERITSYLELLRFDVEELVRCLGEEANE